MPLGSEKGFRIQIEEHVTVDYFWSTLSIIAILLLEGKYVAFFD